MEASRLWMKLATAAEGLLTLGAAPPVTGIVEYSPDEGHRLLRTETGLYEVDSALLDRKTRREFERIGSTLTLKRNTKAIGRKWELLREEARPAGEEPIEKAFVLSEGGDLILHGQVLPSFSDEFGLLEVNGIIYRLKGSLLAPDARNLLARIGSRVTVRTPLRAVDFAWAEPRPAAGPGPGGAGPASQHFEIADGRLSIQGTIEYSPDDRHVLLRSEGTLFRVRRDALPAPLSEESDRIGSEIRLRVPIGAVSMAWNEGEAK